MIRIGEVEWGGVMGWGEQIAGFIYSLTHATVQQGGVGWVGWGEQIAGFIYGLTHATVQLTYLTRNNTPYYGALLKEENTVRRRRGAGYYPYIY